MSNTSKNTTVTPADVAEKAKEEKLVTDVPTQGGKEEKTKAAEVSTEEKDADAPEVEEKNKKTVKDRLKALVQKAKENRQFFLGVVAGSASTALVMALSAKEKVEEIVELTIADEPEPEVEVEGDTDEPTV